MAPNLVGLVSLYEEEGAPEEGPGGHSKKVATCKPRREASPAGVLILDFQLPEL